MQAPSAGELFPKVVVTVPALKPYVDALLSGVGESQNLLRAGQDAHSFSLSSSQRHALAEAEIIITADPGMSPFLTKLLNAEAKRGALVIALTSLNGAEPLPYATENPWLDAAKTIAESKAAIKKDAVEPDDHDHDHDHENLAATDPHLWLDPIRMAALAPALADAIATRSPSLRGTLATNATALSSHLREEVDPALRAIFARHLPRDTMSGRPIVPFINYHDAYQYFMARYGLAHPGSITQRPEEYLGAKTLHTMLTRADQVTIHCVIGESDSPLVKRVAKASGARIVILSPEQTIPAADIASAPWVRTDYDRLLQKTAESFAGCG